MYVVMVQVTNLYKKVSCPEPCSPGHAPLVNRLQVLKSRKRGRWGKLLYRCLSWNNNDVNRWVYCSLVTYVSDSNIFLFLFFTFGSSQDEAEPLAVSLLQHRCLLLNHIIAAIQRTTDE